MKSEFKLENYHLKTKHVISKEAYLQSNITKDVLEFEIDNFLRESISNFLVNNYSVRSENDFYIEKSIDLYVMSYDDLKKIINHVIENEKMKKF